MHEKPYRSVVKSISWRTLGTLDTMIISYFVTGNLVMAASWRTPPRSPRA